MLIVLNKSLQQASSFFESLEYFLYHSYKDSTNPEIMLSLISCMSRFAYQCHPGKFVSEKLESIIKQIAEQHFPKVEIKLYKKEIKSQKKILHIATCLYDVGGHTRFLENWIQLDSQNQHTVLVTQNQNDSKIDSVVVLQSKSILSKSFELNEFINKNEFDLIVLHTHPEEVIAFLALYNVAIPKILVNHSDHTFWLGKNFVDYVVNIREEAVKINLLYRGIDKNLILPLPLRFKDLDITQEEARKKINFPINTPIAISIGSYHKFIPSNSANFYLMLQKIWEKVPELQVYIIGISEKERKIVGFGNDHRLNLLGKITNPSIYCKAANFVIDPVPKGSYTALLEAVGYGAFPVLYYNGIQLFDLSNDWALKNQIYSLNDYCQIAALIKENLEKIEDTNLKSKALADAVRKIHCEKFCNEYLKDIYNFKKFDVKIADKGNSEERLNEYLFDISNKNFSKEVDKLFFTFNQFRLEFSFFQRLKLISIFKDNLEMNNKLKIKTLLKFAVALS